jgi:hypothetical protein
VTSDHEISILARRPRQMGRAARPPSGIWPTNVWAPGSFRVKEAARIMEA